MKILSRFSHWINFIAGMLFLVTLSISKSQDSSAVKAPADTSKPAPIEVKPSQQKRVEAQKDSIEMLFEKVTTPVAVPEKTVKKAKTAANNLAVADKILSQAIDVLVSVVARYPIIRPLDIAPVLPYKVDSLASPSVEVPDIERPGFLKRIFRKHK